MPALGVSVADALPPVLVAGRGDGESAGSGSVTAGWPVLGVSLTVGDGLARPGSGDTVPPHPINVVDTVTLIAADTAARKTFASMAAPPKTRACLLPSLRSYS
jgi:hypothetical protein